MQVALNDLAEILGVNIRTVQRLAQEGVLEALPDPADKRRKVYELAPSVQAYLEHRLQKAESSQRSERLAQLEEKKLEAEAELKESQRDLHQLKTSIANGSYLSKEEVALDYQRFFVVFRKFALAIPPRVAGQIGGFVEPVIARGIEKDLNREITDMLRSFVVAGVERE